MAEWIAGALSPLAEFVTDLLVVPIYRTGRPSRRWLRASIFGLPRGRRRTGWAVGEQCKLAFTPHNFDHLLQ